MNLAIGIILGLLTAILIVATLTYFRRVIEHKVEITTKQIEAKGPKPKGFIIEAESDADEARQEIIKNNKRLGRDTRMEELI